MISKEQIQKFQTLYLNRFGEKISKAEAMEKGAKLINLMRAVYHPIKKSDLKNFKIKINNNYN